MKKLCCLAFVFVLVLVSHTPLYALTVASWSGLTIEGERQDFAPEGNAAFEISGSTLTVTLTNTTSNQIRATGEVLSGLTWDLDGFAGSLDPLLAEIAPGSGLVGVDAGLYAGVTDLSSEWGFKDNIMAGVDIGSFGIGAVGDINLGADTFGVGDRFDTIDNLFPDPPSGSLNGIEGGIAGFNIDLTADGLPSAKGPLVQNQMIFTFTIYGSLTEGMITNIRPMFGTDGAFTTTNPPIPEPTTILLVGLGLLGIAGFRKKLRK